jgi:lysophospholipase L1-like esterase
VDIEKEQQKVEAGSYVAQFLSLVKFVHLISHKVSTTYQLSFGCWLATLILFGTVPMSLYGQSQSQGSNPQRIPECAHIEEFQKRADAARPKDWAGLEYYREQNMRLSVPSAKEDRVVFMGDSILGLWYLPKSFPGQPYVNRAMAGQGTAQMLLRFQTDVVNLRPKVVVIMGGINDLRGSQYQGMLEGVEENLACMSEIAQKNGIAVILASVMPVRYGANGATPTEKLVSDNILTLNSWLESFAKENGIYYVDLYAAVADGNSELRASLTVDGVHPNETGYGIMKPLVEAGIKNALRH